LFREQRGGKRGKKDQGTSLSAKEKSPYEMARGRRGKDPIGRRKETLV